MPHNLSTLKLLDPNKSYKEHFETLAKRSEPRVPRSVTDPALRANLSRVSLYSYLPDWGRP